MPKKKQKKQKQPTEIVISMGWVIDDPSGVLEARQAVQQQTPAETAMVAFDWLDRLMDHARTCTNARCLRRHLAEVPDYRRRLQANEGTYHAADATAISATIDQLEAALIDRGVEVGRA